ncbi:uncharacterized protein LOC103524437 [Diaphorina citri]|uniref:Uncharacterized protein LOC103524437 n=1 Tax=Diaphorina citri TaxID=121845 RepID=A0A3Q0IHK3_DIACI|nr:uncharacterized protein LOC103524437 [Diaphorina citri]
MKDPPPLIQIAISYILTLRFMIGVYGGNDIWPLERPDGMPAIQSLEVMCGKDHMDVHLQFTQPFEGIVSSKGQFVDPRCVYVPPSTGKTFFSFRIAYSRCGTKPDLHGQFYENTIVVQYDKDLLEVWDEAKRLRCEWYNDYEKTASKPPMVIADLDVIQLDFRGKVQLEFRDAILHIAATFMCPTESPYSEELDVNFESQQGPAPTGATGNGHQEKFPHGPRNLNTESETILGSSNDTPAAPQRRRRSGIDIRRSVVLSDRKARSTDVGVSGLYEVISEADLAFTPDNKLEAVTVFQGRIEEEVVYGICLPVQGFSALFVLVAVSAVVSALIAGALLYRYQVQRETQKIVAQRRHQTASSSQTNGHFGVNAFANWMTLRLMGSSHMTSSRGDIRQLAHHKPMDISENLICESNLALREFDMRVKSCVASDGAGHIIHLSDEHGCVLRPKMISRFLKARINDERASVITYAFFHAFKFPDALSVHIKCKVEICRHGCLDHCQLGGGEGAPVSTGLGIDVHSDIPTGYATPLERKDSLAQKHNKIDTSTPSASPDGDLIYDDLMNLHEENEYLMGDAGLGGLRPKAQKQKSELPLRGDLPKPTQESQQGPAPTGATGNGHQEKFPHGPRNLNTESETILGSSNDTPAAPQRRRRSVVLSDRKARSTDVGVSGLYEVISEADLAFTPDNKLEAVTVFQGRIEEEVVYGICLPVQGFSALFVLVAVSAVVSALIAGALLYRYQVQRETQKIVAQRRHQTASSSQTNGHFGVNAFANWMTLRLMGSSHMTSSTSASNSNHER